MTRESLLLVGHTSYVQGTAWDPHNQMLVTQSSDRSCKIHQIKFKDGITNALPKLQARGHAVMRMHHGYSVVTPAKAELTAADFNMAVLLLIVYQLVRRHLILCPIS